MKQCALHHDYSAPRALVCIVHSHLSCDAYTYVASHDQAAALKEEPCTAVLQHEPGEQITALCCTEAADNAISLIVTATCNDVGSGAVHNLHIWRVRSEVVSDASLEVTKSVTLDSHHPQAITSICAVPPGADKNAAYVTCSKGDSSQPNGDYFGRIMLWDNNGTALCMRLGINEVTQLNCDATVSRVISTVNSNKETLIAACNEHFIELWNVTTGTHLEPWQPGALHSNRCED
jgi:hypothetical protein